MARAHLLVIIEDDASVRRSLVRWAKVNQYEVQSFDSASAFLASGIAPRDACLVLDLGLQGISGGELKRQLIAAGRDLPTVFITGYTDDEIAAELAGLDARHVLHKPFDEAALAAAIEAVP